MACYLCIKNYPVELSLSLQLFLANLYSVKILKRSCQVENDFSAAEDLRRNNSIAIREVSMNYTHHYGFFSTKILVRK